MIDAFFYSDYQGYGRGKFNIKAVIIVISHNNLGSRPMNIAGQDLAINPSVHARNSA
jgi:hypothetical protein